MNTSIKHQINLVTQCYEQIQNLIINGTFAPGKKLKLKDLKQLLQVGTSPIREALSRLTTSGLVVTEDNKGFRVTKISEANIRDIYHTFLSIELLALTQAMKYGDDTWKASIVATLYSLSLIEHNQQTTSQQLWVERNYAFHLALISGCNSPALLRIRADIYRHFDRYCQISFNILHTMLEHNHEEHKQLADAVLNRNINAATTLMTQHLLGSLESIIALFKKNNFF